ncbi:hypothetical protein CC86DRAFT_358042 [Ophiobolus disseminans]|uniref:Zn(2)-C6 fungal-type domain-containing protein n=1 Tax=Ophiobolus disseminans TaxID=1469910 RepID=A0A6A6ZLR1_9PLEO|nr:hypothetical protein CC86DRAFT_358042 [Ophiobolus disseminans]
MSDGRKRPLTSLESRPAYPRKRAARACLTCRRRRTKCDNEQPSCTSCTALQVECVYREIDKASFDPASLAILQRLDDLEALYKAGNHGTAALPAAVQGNPSPVLEYGSVPSADLDFEDNVETRFVNVEAILDWPILCMDAFRPRRGLLNLLRAPSGIIIQRSLLAADMNVKEALKLLDLFVTHFHNFNPVLDISKVEEHIKFTGLNGLEWDAWSCLLLLIYALGSTVSDGDELPPHSSVKFRNTVAFERSEAFFSAAQKRMGSLLFGSDLTEAQVFFLAGVYLMTTLRPVEAWRAFVQALTCCQSLQSLASDAAPEEAQLRQGVYWTCFKSELEVRMELGITETSVWNLRYPAAYPEPPKSLRSEGEPAWYFYLAEIALRRLQTRILMSTCRVVPAGNALLERSTSAFEFERQANRWAESLPESLQNNMDSDQPTLLHDERPHFRFILSGHLLDCLEMIYWPFCEGAILGNLTSDLDCNILADRGFEICVQRIEENEPGFYFRHHGTWLMLRSCTRSALVLVIAAHSGLGQKMPARWREAVEKVIHLLNYWKEEVADVEDRLEVLQSLALQL